jgi:hypothetical protein
MKKSFVLPLFLLLSYSALFAQETDKKTIKVSANRHMKKFLDSRNKQKPGILLEPLTIKEYPQQITLADSLRNRIVRKENQRIITNSIPVWSPGSDYVFNMPGTFAYEKNQARIHVPRLVTVVPNKGTASEKSASSIKK